MKKRIQNLMALVTGLVAFYRLIRNPKELDRVIELAQKLAQPEILGAMADHAASRSPVASKALEVKPRLDLNELYKMKSSLPQDSLGALFLKFLEERNLNPADLPTFLAPTREAYVQAHLFETHDIWHVVCDFETDVAGELGLQAFYLAQLPAPLAMLILAAGMLNTIFFGMSDRERRMNEIMRGWSLGKRAKQLFGTNWNELWLTRIHDVRSQFGLI